MNDVDPVTLEVVRNSLIADCGEMATVLRKTAYNPMIFEVRDYCVGLVDVEGGLIAQNTGGLPIFLADLGVAVEDGIAKHSLSGFKPGDAIVMNYGDICGQHLNNVVVYTPAFVDGVDYPVAFPSTRAHWVDIGGKRIGFGATDTTEIYHEGLQLRSARIMKAGELDEDIAGIIRANVRQPDECMGDFRAQLAACRLGERRVQELYARYGAEVVQACINAIRDQSERLARAAVAKIPDGEYRSEAWLDSDGQVLDRRVPIKVRVDVDGDEMTVDFSDMSDQVLGPINSGRSGGNAAARVAFKALTLPSHPVDEGGFRNLHVELPEGKLLSAKRPAALGQWSIPLPTVIDTIIAALAPALPHEVPASHMGTMNGFSIYGDRTAGEKQYVCLSITGGGWGGRHNEDGPSAAVSVCQGDVQNVPVELQEARFPLHFDFHRLREGSGGAGKYRGGMGIELGITPQTRSRSNINNERRSFPPAGLNGGLPGSVNSTLVREHDGAQWEEVDKRTGTLVEAGGRLIYQTAGGGGWGDPFERDPYAVLDDVRQGYISIDDAASKYGLILTDADSIDWDATEDVRNRAHATNGR